MSPLNQRIGDQKWHEKYNVQIEAWAPFAEGINDLFTNRVLVDIGKQYDKTVGQVVLRWLIQKNYCFSKISSSTTNGRKS